MKVGGNGLGERGNGGFGRLQVGRQAEVGESARGDRPDGGAHHRGGQSEARGL